MALHPVLVDHLMRRHHVEPALAAPLADPGFVEKLFDCMPDIVFYVKDRQRRYVAVNDTLVRRCGLASKAQALGRTVLDVYRSDLSAAYFQQDLLVLETGAEIRGRLEREIYADGSVGWCVVYKLPVRDAAGQIIGLTGFCKDLHRSDEEQESYRRVAQSIHHLQENFTEPLRIKDLARRSGLSVSRFERLVKQIFGVTPREFLIHTRLGAASRMLLATDASVTDVAHACGYVDHSAFTRQFKVAAGVTPTAFREAAAAARGGRAPVPCTVTDRGHPLC